jgi:ParB-like chromosome segregation protein Spo0J
MSKKKATAQPAGAHLEDNRVAEIRVVDIERVTPRYPDPADNPNKMEPERFDLLVKAIAQEGFLQPLLVTQRENDYLIEDGHHRLDAALKAGLKQVSIAITHAAKPQDEARAKLLGLGMNRLRGELDLRLASDIIREVQDALSLETLEVSILTGFTEEELLSLLKDTDDIDLEDESASEVGDTLPDDALVFLLELQFGDREQFKLAKRRLKKLGGGNMTTGLMIALAEDE